MAVGFVSICLFLHSSQAVQQCTPQPIVLLMQRTDEVTSMQPVMAA